MVDDNPTADDQPSGSYGSYHETTSKMFKALNLLAATMATCFSKAFVRQEQCVGRIVQLEASFRALSAEVKSLSEAPPESPRGRSPSL